MLESFTRTSDRVLAELGMDAELPWLQLLPPALGGGIVVRKDLGFLGGFEIEPVPSECADDPEKERRSEEVRGVLHGLPVGAELQIDVHRRRLGDLRVPKVKTKHGAILELEEARRRHLVAGLRKSALENRVRLYLSWNPSRVGPGIGFVSSLLFPRVALRDFRERQHRMAVREFRGHLDALRAGLQGIGVTARPLDNAGLVAGLRSSVNAGHGELAPNLAEALPWQYLSDRVSATEIVVGIRHLRFGGKYVKVLSHRSYPDAVVAFCLEELATLPFEYRVVLSVEITDQKRELASQDHWRRVAKNWSKNREGEENDKGAKMKEAAHDSVLDALYSGQKLLPVSVNFVLWADDEEVLESRVREVSAVWCQSMRGSDLLSEGIAGYEVFRSTLPGNLGASGRRKRYLSPKVADQAVGLLAGSASAGRCGHTTFYNRRGGLVPFSIFGEEARDLLARNCLLFGTSGGGKSVAFGAIVLGVLVAGGVLRLLDVGGSTALLVEIAGGVCQRFTLRDGERTDVTNPCDIASLDGHEKAFLISVISAITTKEGQGGLHQADEGRLAGLLQWLYNRNPTPGAIVLGDIEDALNAYRTYDPNASDSEVERMRDIGARLAIATKGAWSRILNQRSTRRLDEELAVHYDFQECARDQRFLRIVMPCVAHDIYNMIHRVGPGRPKAVGTDEGWQLTKTRMGEAIFSMPRVARKAHLSFIACSQSLGDFNTPELRDAVINNSGLKFLYPCPEEDQETMAKVFKLNDRELSQIQSLRTVKGHYSEAFFMRPRARQVVRLSLPPEHYWVLTTDPPDIVAREQAFERFETKWEAIEWLARTYPRGVEASRDDSSRSSDVEVLSVDGNPTQGKEAA